jgi:branched-chain amino acid transport system permease protein
MQDLINAGSLGCVYLLFAVGMSLLWGTIGILNFAHGSIFMFAAFVNFLVLQHVAFSLPMLLLIGAASGAVLAVAAHLLAFQPILRFAPDYEARERQQLICGIGLASIPVALAEIKTLGQPFSLSRSKFAVHSYVAGGLRISNIQILTIAITVVAVTAILLWVRYSRHGLALRALGIDSETARLMGASETSLGLVTMAAGGVLAGIGGTVLAFMFGALDAQSGGTLLIKAFAIIILGGVGSVAGTAVGSFLLAGAETVVVSHTSGAWVDAVSFGLLFLFLVARPQGIFGRREVKRT